MSKFGAKTYGRKHDCRLAPPLDQMILDKGDSKASSAKMSVAAVHRWGVTSFTSLRKAAQVNGQAELDGTSPTSSADASDGLCTSALDEDPFSFDGDQEEPPAVSSAKGSSCLSGSLSDATRGSRHEKMAPKPKKFFKSRSSSSSSSSSLAGQTSARAVAQFDKLRSSSSGSTFVTLSDRREPASKIGALDDDKVEFRCVKLEKSSRAAAHHKDFAVPAVPPIVVRTVVASVPAVLTAPSLRIVESEPVAVKKEKVEEQPQASEVETVSRARPSVRTYSRKRNSVAPPSVPEDHASAKRTLVEPPAGCNTAEDDMVLLGASDKGSAVEVECVDSGPEPSEGSPVGDKDEDGPGSSQDDAPTSQEAVARSTSSSSSKSIFKSKRIFQSPKKPKAVYKMRHWQMPESEELELEQDTENQNSLAEEFEDDLFGDEKLTKEVHQPSRPWKEAITSVKCPRKAKELYTVVRNVKQAYQCHESGETQEFNDDIDYLLEGVQPSNPIAARCLSVVGLASKCMVPAFRMHLRAHGIMSKFFSALTDAPSDPSLSLCTATLFFVLSQDRLTMDLDASTLSLMLQLFESDPQQQGLAAERVPCPSQPCASSSSSSTSVELMERHREKVQQLCEQMQQKGHAKHLNLNKVNTGTLALETLLSLTSRRAGEWFKEELRLQGGLTHIVNTVRDCLFYFGDGVTLLENPTEFQLEKLRKIDRCSRVLENVTYMNTDNQIYLLDYKDSLMVASYIRLLLLCQTSLMVHPVKPEAPAAQNNGAANVAAAPRPCENQTTSVMLQNMRGPGAVFFSCLLSVLRVLLNITHESALGSSVVGSQPGLLCAILLCILQVPKSVPTEQRFDLLVLVRTCVHLNVKTRYVSVRFLA